MACGHLELACNHSRTETDLPNRAAASTVPSTAPVGPSFQKLGCSFEFRLLFLFGLLINKTLRVKLSHRSVRNSTLLKTVTMSSMAAELLKMCRGILSLQEESGLPMLVHQNVTQDLEGLCEKLKQTQRYSKVPLPSLKTSVEKLAKQEMLNLAVPKLDTDNKGNKGEDSLGKRDPLSPHDKQMNGLQNGQPSATNETDVGFIRSSPISPSNQGTSSDQVHPSVGHPRNG